MNYDDRIKLNVFDSETTNQTDYRVPPLEPYIKHRWPNDRCEKRKDRPRPPHVYTCLETLTKLRDTEYVPANLTWCPRPIIDPPTTYCNIEKELLDPHKEESIKTRPRVYMGSAVSLDDVPDKEIRNMLIKYTYTTDFKRCMKEAQEYVHTQTKLNQPKHEDCEKVPEAVVPCVIKDENVRIKTKEYFPEVDGRLRATFDEWDQRQTRATIDPNELFWRKFYERKRANQKTNSEIAPETIDRLTDLVQTNRLRLPHDKATCGYAGYVPDITGIGTERIDLPLTHPMHTTNDTVFVNHYDHASGYLEK